MSNPPTYYCFECQQNRPLTDPCRHIEMEPGVSESIAALFAEPHGPTCIGLDNGCPDCLRLKAAGAEQPRETLPQPTTLASIENELRNLHGRHAALLERCIALERHADRTQRKVSTLTRRFEQREREQREREPFTDPAGLPERSRDETLERLTFGGDEPLPRPTADDKQRWQNAAAELPGPIGRAISILLAEVDRLEALLARVRCYAVVDPLGNPAAICLPNAARMLGIESDIDDALRGRPIRES